MQYHLQLSTVALVSVTLELITSQSLCLRTLFYGGMFLSHTSRQLLFLIIKMI